MALAMVVVALCAPLGWAHGQVGPAHNARTQAPAPRISASSRPAAHPAAPASRGASQAAPRGQAQQQGMWVGSAPSSTMQRSAGGTSGRSEYSSPTRGAGSSGRPDYPGPPYLGPGYARPTVPGYAPPADLPAGHLGAWLNEHRNLPVQDQERIQRNDPSFRRLTPTNQQRLVQQLHQVNGLTEEQRQRRLARTEIIEHLSPQDRMQVERSYRRWPTLPVERQALMKAAFRDLRSVPVDQRQTVLNSSRYQGVFTPEERGILSDFLRVEPYQPAR